jgi:hypothetical protein
MPRLTIWIGRATVAHSNAAEWGGKSDATVQRSRDGSPCKVCQSALLQLGCAQEHINIDHYEHKTGYDRVTNELYFTIQVPCYSIYQFLLCLLFDFPVTYYKVVLRRFTHI